MKRYNEGFYARRHKKTLHAANTVLSLLLEMIPPVRSAVDVGCGVGTWLAVLREKGGTTDIKGIDGSWVDRAHLEIPEETFDQADLTKPLTSPRHYDLAISLEVAEHLPPESAESFVASLTSLADFVLFSSAIPGQGGDHHLNEQWQDYWAGLFSLRGYVVVDRIREQIWELDRIPVWYRQNILLFVKQERLAEVKPPVAAPPSPPARLARVHPHAYLEKVRQHASVKDCWTLLRRAVRASVAKKLKLGSRISGLLLLTSTDSLDLILGCLS